MTLAQTETKTLYERLGGEAGLRAIANNVIDAHLANPHIGTRFRHGDPAHAKQMAFEFFASGSGGPQAYTGQDLPTAHAGMNIGEGEFVFAVDDVLAVLQQLGIGASEQGDVLNIFFALKDQVLHK